MSLEAIYREHYGLVRWVLRARGVPEAALEDLVHDVFVAIQHRLPARDRDVPLRSWIAGVARNVSFSARRSLARRECRVEQLPRPPDPPWPDELVAQREAWAALDRFLDELGPEQREVFVMVEMSGMRVSELAELMGLPPNTLHSRLKAARTRFARAFGDLVEPTADRLARAREGARAEPRQKARTWALVTATTGGVPMLSSAGTLGGAAKSVGWLFGLGNGIAVATGIAVAGLVAIALSRPSDPRSDELDAKVRADASARRQASGAARVEQAPAVASPATPLAPTAAGVASSSSTGDSGVVRPIAGSHRARPSLEPQSQALPVDTPPDPDAALAAATRAIEAARRELEAGRARDALATLEGLAEQFGALDRERRRIEIDAACRIGDVDRARRAARALAGSGALADADHPCPDRVEETRVGRCRNSPCDD